MLLFRASISGPDARVFWIAPGGGCNPGESYEDAARRELWEEIGLSDCVLGPCVWQREHVFYWEPEDVWYRQQERYYVARVPAHEVVTRYQEPGEAQFMTAHRWWTPAELHASPDRLVPGDFAILFDALQHDGAPSQPVVVGL